MVSLNGRTQKFRHFTSTLSGGDFSSAVSIDSHTLTWHWKYWRAVFPQCFHIGQVQLVPVWLQYIGPIALGSGLPSSLSSSCCLVIWFLRQCPTSSCYMPAPLSFSLWIQGQSLALNAGSRFHICSDECMLAWGFEVLFGFVETTKNLECWQNSVFICSVSTIKRNMYNCVPAVCCESTHLSYLLINLWAHGSGGRT